MSVDYADSLKKGQYRGRLGEPEQFDPPDVILSKAKCLANFIRSARHTVLHTGAGVSTSAGIPDFRGPNGVWTLEERGIKVNYDDVAFGEAQPTLCHRAIAELERRGLLAFLITQNIDGLHGRSGFPWDRMVTLHGDKFVERCNRCHRRHFFDAPSRTMTRKFTGRQCQMLNSKGVQCEGRLRDTIMDWNQALPSDYLNQAIHQSRLADLSIAVGTSLQMQFSQDLPVLAKRRKNGRLVLVNLQPTEYDDDADLVIRARADDVFSALMSELEIALTDYDGPRKELCSVHGAASIPKKRKQLTIPKRPFRKAVKLNDVEEESKESILVEKSESSSVECIDLCSDSDDVDADNKILHDPGDPTTTISNAPSFEPQVNLFDKFTLDSQSSADSADELSSEPLIQ